MQWEPEKIKALALDMDGTILLPGAVLGERTLRVLRGCLARGIRVIFCTGRSVQSVEPYRKLVGAGGPAVYFNGAMVAGMPEGLLHRTVFLDREAAGFCVDVAREMGVYVQVYFSGGEDPLQELLLADRDVPEAEFYRKQTGVRPVFGDLKRALGDGSGGVLKCLFIASPGIVERIRPRILERFGGGVYITKSSPRFLEVLDGGASKGTGLAFVMEKLCLAPEEVMAFGDEENDLPLFRTARYSAAPANARPKLRAAAGFITGSCAEEGPAEFLEKTFLS